MVDSYKPPPIDSLIASLQGAQWFSALDLQQSFWQLGMHPSSEDATAFSLPGVGHFSWRRLVMGLRNASAVQQRHVDRIFIDELYKSIVCRGKTCFASNGRTPPLVPSWPI